MGTLKGMLAFLTLACFIGQGIADERKGKGKGGEPPSKGKAAGNRRGARPNSSKPETNGRVVIDKNGYTITTDDSGKVAVIDKNGNNALNAEKSEYRTVTENGAAVVKDKVGNSYTADKDGRIIITDPNGKAINPMPTAASDQGRGFRGRRRGFQPGREK